MYLLWNFPKVSLSYGKLLEGLLASLCAFMQLFMYSWLLCAWKELNKVPKADKLQGELIQGWKGPGLQQQRFDKGV